MPKQQIKEAVAALKSGLLIAFPTETVYGLGADATNPAAVEKVFLTKGRPANHPVIVHISNVEALSNWARDIPSSVFKLAAQFWPGPLTLILKKQTHVSPIITGGLDTIAIRIPNHPLTLELLNEFGGAIVGPSANKYGRVSPTQAQHVIDDLQSAVAVVLDGGPCTVGIESTILDLSTEKPIIRRHGAITIDQLSKILQQNIATDVTTPNAPGTHLAHYAPKTPLLLINTEQLTAIKSNCAVISFKRRPVGLPESVYWIQETLDPEHYAHELYANLRALDKLNKQVIIVEQPPTTLPWQAITDRLQRACTK